MPKGVYSRASFGHGIKKNCGHSIHTRCGICYCPDCITNPMRDCVSHSVLHNHGGFIIPPVDAGIPLRDDAFQDNPFEYRLADDCEFHILSDNLLGQFINEFSNKLDDVIDRLDKIETPVDYFRFYNSISSVYSSKIEGEEIDFDSYFKHKFLNVNYQPDYTSKSDDLFNAYEFIFKNSLNLINLKSAHAILTSNLLPSPFQGFVRTNPMFVVNSVDRIDYVAAILNEELTKLFDDIETLLAEDLSNAEILFFASHIHLTFVKIGVIDKMVSY